MMVYRYLKFLLRVLFLFIAPDKQVNSGKISTKKREVGVSLLVAISTRKEKQLAF